jgi:hypothetical protein
VREESEQEQKQGTKKGSVANSQANLNRGVAVGVGMYLVSLCKRCGPPKPAGTSGLVPPPPPPPPPPPRTGKLKLGCPKCRQSPSGCGACRKKAELEPAAAAREGECSTSELTATAATTEAAAVAAAVVVVGGSARSRPTDLMLIRNRLLPADVAAALAKRQFVQRYARRGLTQPTPLHSPAIPLTGSLTFYAGGDSQYAVPRDRAPARAPHGGGGGGGRCGGGGGGRCGGGGGDGAERRRRGGGAGGDGGR